MSSGDYSKVNKLLLIGGLVYYFWPQIQASLSAYGLQLPDFSRPLLPAGPGAPAGLLVGPEQPPEPAAPGAGGRPSVIGAIGGTATSLAGAALAGGASFATIGIVSGVGAAAVILAWGIIKQGWFRGGIEGVVVNPARDHFLSQFAPLDYMRDAKNPPGFYGLFWLLNALDPGSAQALFDGLTKSHKKDQFAAAVEAIQASIAAKPDQFAQLWEFARRDSSAPQRAVSPAA